MNETDGEEASEEEEEAPPAAAAGAPSRKRPARAGLATSFLNKNHCKYSADKRKNKLIHEPHQDYPD